MRISYLLLCFLAACQSPPKNRVDWDFQIPDRKGSTQVYLDSTAFYGGGRGVDSVASPICVESALPWEGKGKQVPGFSSEFLHRGTYGGPAVYQVVFYSRNSSSLWLVRLGSVSATQGTLR
ncbi:MAG: hypothetical protein ACO28S_08070, partial [Bacteroidia bacterium]